MAMMRPRRQPMRTQSSLGSVYEEFKPESKIAENSKEYVLQIHLPGFTKERIRVQYDGSSHLIRYSGERPIGGNKRSRFRGEYQVPADCNINQIQSHFRQEILTITLPKKNTSQAEVKQTQEQAHAGSPSQKADQQVIPPKSAATQQETRDDQKTASSPPSTSGTGPYDMKGTPSQKPVIDSQKAEAEKKEDGVPQKANGETETKPTLKLDQQEMDEKNQKGKEVVSETKPKLEMAPGDKMDEKPQKGQEENEPKLTPEMVPRKPLDGKPERDHEGTKQKATLTSTPGEQSGEKPEERRSEDIEKEMISSKEIIEEKSSESRKIGNGVKEKSMDKEREITERRELVQPGEHSVPKIPEKRKETASKAKAVVAAMERNLNDGMNGNIGKGVIEVTTTVSQALTRIAEGKWDNEDKHLLLNIGASVLVLAALGGYALYSSLKN